AGRPTYLTTRDGTVVIIDEHRNVLARIRLASVPIVLSSPASDGSVRAALSRDVVSISPSGRVLWRRSVSKPIVGGPVLAPDGTAYVAITAFEGTPRGQLVRIDEAGGVVCRKPPPVEPSPP